jgi:DNA-binding beta-propeller fold protein YncE
MRLNRRGSAAGIVTAVWLAAISSGAGAQRVELVAGGGERSEGQATECKVDEPFASGKGRSGTLYCVEYSGRVVAIDKKGRLRRIAGGNGEGSGGDNGPASKSQLSSPHHLLVLPDGDLLVADTMNNRIRRIEMRTGKIVAFAGTGAAGFGGDGGPAIKAQFGAVYCLALDTKRGALFVDDLDNRRIRKIDLRTGVVTTVAGDGKRGVPKDGDLATESPLVDPRAVATDSKGNLYILERSGNALRVVGTDGRIRTVVGSGAAGPADDGPARSATLRGPKHLTADRDDSILIADSDNHCIRRYLPKENKIVRVVGTGKEGASAPGSGPLETDLKQPHGIYVDSGGAMYICDSMNNRILRIVREK